MEHSRKISASDFTERTVFKYLKEMMETKSPSTVCSRFSMLKTMIGLEQNIDLDKFLKIKALLKRNMTGYKPKKLKVLRAAEVNTLLKTAPNDQYTEKKHQQKLQLMQYDMLR